MDFSTEMDGEFDDIAMDTVRKVVVSRMKEFAKLI
jgi:hypothetical protein